MERYEGVSLAQQFAHIDRYWDPRIAGEINDSHLKLAKLKGEFVWHKHDTEDEMFLVVKGTLLIRLRDAEITVHEGQFTIIPHGIEHLPVAEEEVHVLLLEPKTTVNTGEIRNERTVDHPKRI